MSPAQDALGTRARHRRQGEDAADRLGVLHGPAQEDADGPQDRTDPHPAAGPVLAAHTPSDGLHQKRSISVTAFLVLVASTCYCRLFARSESAACDDDFRYRLHGLPGLFTDT